MSKGSPAGAEAPCFSRLYAALKGRSSTTRAYSLSLTQG
jgi:hypothetical protein